MPALFQRADVGSQAFAAYFNSRAAPSDELKVKVLDHSPTPGRTGPRPPNSPEQSAFLGSFSTFDDADAALRQRRGRPDVGYA